MDKRAKSKIIKNINEDFNGVGFVRQLYNY